MKSSLRGEAGMGNFGETHIEASIKKVSAIQGMARNGLTKMAQPRQRGGRVYVEHFYATATPRGIAKSRPRSERSL